ncbi:MAG: nitrous oxide reductase accessory protein NosL [Bacteroidetes bacterium]|nr:nitrous oxide reductase accessory protein NosL [Bacteroidota bacterium]
MSRFSSILGLFFILLFAACSNLPEPIRVGKDNCSFCKMTISDVRFGVELVTQKGKVIKYDEIHCMLEALNSGEMQMEMIREIYFTDFCGKHLLIPSKNAFLLSSDALKSPMGGNIAVFSSNDSLLITLQKVKGKQVLWEDIFH